MEIRDIVCGVGVLTLVILIDAKQPWFVPHEYDHAEMSSVQQLWLPLMAVTGSVTSATSASIAVKGSII